MSVEEKRQYVFKSVSKKNQSKKGVQCSVLKAATRCKGIITQRPREDREAGCRNKGLVKSGLCPSLPEYSKKETHLVSLRRN